MIPLLASLSSRQKVHRNSFRMGLLATLAAAHPLLWCPEFGGCQWNAPPTPADQPAWLANLTSAASQVRAMYSPYIYETFPQLNWTRRAFVAPQAMIHDKYLFDRSLGEFTVNRFLDDLEARYGGIDAVLLWHSYPNMGIDNRNQFDQLTDLPGGLAALKQVIAQFNARGVVVGGPYNPWDTGTERPSSPDNTTLASMWASVGFQFFNGDTMSFIPSSFWNASVAAGNPLGIQPEGGPQDNSLEWSTMGWAYWSWAERAPPVDFWHFVEPRHMTQLCDRWATNRTNLLQFAWFNGVGHVSWENVWGIWNAFSPRDGEAARRLRPLLSFYAPFFSLPPGSWIPHDPLVDSAYQGGLFASRFSAAAGAVPYLSKNATLWTVVNRSPSNYTGPVIVVPSSCSASTNAASSESGGATTVYFDVYNGKTVSPSPIPNGNGACGISLTVEDLGYGGILAVDSTDASNPAVLAQMQTMAALAARGALDSYSTTNLILNQTMWDNGRTVPASSPPPQGMLAIPANPAWQFVVSGIEIEGDDTPGIDVMYPGEPVPYPTRNHNFTVDIPPFFIDATPVTNAQYLSFITASTYWPSDPGAHNFLKDWTCTPPPVGSGQPASCTYPQGWDKKPVTWTSPEDARAYCAFYDKRLPNEWEWQYAAQGTDGRLYPWGNTWNASNVPPQVSGPTLPGPSDVDAHPGGVSPFGMLDAVGNVWQWTNVFTDDHTTAAILRGGGYYRANTSGWYFRSAFQLNQHSKYLLMAPSMDRRGTISFRCVVDAAAQQ